MSGQPRRRGSIIRRVKVGGGLMIIVLAAAFALSAHASRRVSTASEERGQAEAVSDAAGQALRLVLDLETGQRGYLITGEERFLAPWRSARRALPDALRSFEAAASELGVSEDARGFRVAAVDYLRDYSTPLIELARDDLEKARAVVRTGEGVRRTDELRRIAQSATGRASKVAAASAASAGGATRLALGAGVLGFLVSVGLVVGFLVYLTAAVLRPIRRTASAAGALRRGDLTSRLEIPRPRELAEMAMAFNAMAETLQDNERQLQARHCELEVARQEAEAASRAKNEFLSRMSHELRTPLNAILGFGQILELDGDHPEETGHILRAGRHLLDLINEVLDIASIESGDLKVSLEPVCASDLLREAIDMIDPLASAAGLRVQRDLEPCGSVHVLADRQRLKQVMLNLLANAVKYNVEDGQVSVSCELDPAEGTLMLVVRDTGIGIGEDDLERIFRPFERLSQHQEKIEGTGLGLALTRHLVEAMNGEVQVESEVGKGSVFRVALSVADPPADGGGTEDGPQVLTEVSHGTAKTVLYIEDNASNLKLMDTVLARRPGVTLLSAIQGSLGLRLAFEHRPDLVLLDLGLPDMKGHEVLRRLRADPRTAGTPIFVVSADATESQVGRVRGLGATGYLSKPFNIGRLLEIVDGALAPQDVDPTADDAQSADVLDPDFVEGLVQMHDESQEQADRVQDLLRLFRDDAAALSDELRAAHGAGDHGKTAEVAHKLIGTSGSIGAFRLVHVCRQIEQKARDGEEVGSLVDQLPCELRAVDAALLQSFGDASGGVVADRPH